MAKSRQLKHKLKHYNVPKSSNSTVPQQESVLSVNDRLAQLRIEHLRSEQNRRVRTTEEQHQPMAAPLALIDMTADAAAGMSSRRPRTRVAGPPPPPSWRIQRKVRLPCPPPPPPLPYPPSHSSSLESLRTICAAKAADAIVLRPALAARLSVQTKQWVLGQLGHRLTDPILRYFKDDVYGELCIQQAKVSFAAFVRGFWKTAPLKPKAEVTDDWWEEEEEEEEDDDEETEVPTTQDYVEEQEGYVHRNDRRLDSVLDVVGRQGQVLTTPLSAKLVSFDMSFLPQFPVSFGYLVAFTLPHLTRLVMPGSTASADVLLVLSRELKMLQYWDIGFHAWLTPHFVCRDIRWDRNLRRLKTLCVVNTGPDGNTGTQVVQELREVRPQLQVQYEYQV